MLMRPRRRLPLIIADAHFDYCRRHAAYAFDAAYRRRR